MLCSAGLPLVLDQEKVLVVQTPVVDKQVYKCHMTCHHTFLLCLGGQSPETYGSRRMSVCSVCVFRAHFSATTEN